MSGICDCKATGCPNTPKLSQLVIPAIVVKFLLLTYDMFLVLLLHLSLCS